MSYTQTKAETQSGFDRIAHAEALILHLPEDHDGRNTWLLNYGTGDEARSLRAVRGIAWIRETQSAETTTSEVKK
jgi:hypothetical protein